MTTELTQRQPEMVIPVDVCVGGGWRVTTARARSSPLVLLTFMHPDSADVGVRFDLGKAMFLDTPPTCVLHRELQLIVNRVGDGIHQVWAALVNEETT